MKSLHSIVFQNNNHFLVNFWFSKYLRRSIGCVTNVFSVNVTAHRVVVVRWVAADRINY